MKSYTTEEVHRFIEEIECGRNEIQNKISALRGKRKSMKVWDIETKKEIDCEIERLTIESTCHGYAILMLYMYEDSLRSNSSPMKAEELIRCEKKAEVGDGLSKLIIFCHKCFIEHAIVAQDLKRLEIEANERNCSSAYILYGYNMFFRDS